MFTKQALKSNKGTQDWRRLFAIMGSITALRERTALVPGTPSDPKELSDELLELVTRLNVINRLQAYRTLISVRLRPAEYYLFELDPEHERLRVQGFKRHEKERAEREYLELERTNTLAGLGTDTLLVSVNSMNDLRRAYPNYFADTQVFLREVQRALPLQWEVVDSVSPRARPERHLRP